MKTELVLIGILAVGVYLLGSQAGSAGWFDNKGEPSQDVWQESCNPVIAFANGPTCQQTNYLIKQHAEEIQLLERLEG